MKRGPHTLISSKDVYTNPWIRVHEDKIVRENGQEGLYGIVEYSPGVATVALNNKGEMYLVKEYLYAADEDGICLPGGGVESHESPLEAAKKELREEAGVTADEWIELGCVKPYPMVVNGPQYLFLAKGARIVSGHEKEFTLITVPFAKAVDMVMRGEITHAASCIAILKAKQLLDTAAA